jgi:hypothetical protein
MVKRVPQGDEYVLRPNLDLIRESDVGNETVINVMKESWGEDPDCRPDFHTIRSRLKCLREGK